ncbi:hypothetical protein H5410_037137 [Solanum commersonii]|uniref:Uncharacterized protein n=1 Tax=Solanum commersonii TaxID=4109 RepID=A0A9J5Y697_SOLCO|nr:hypothetical protein H5410_037137 [Solanum commersonii]
MSKLDHLTLTCRELRINIQPYAAENITTIDTINNHFSPTLIYPKLPRKYPIMSKLDHLTLTGVVAKNQYPTIRRENITTPIP